MSVLKPENFLVKKLTHTDYTYMITKSTSSGIKNCPVIVGWLIFYIAPKPGTNFHLGMELARSTVEGRENVRIGFPALYTWI